MLIPWQQNFLLTSALLHNLPLEDITLKIIHYMLSLSIWTYREPKTMERMCQGSEGTNSLWLSWDPWRSTQYIRSSCLKSPTFRQQSSPGLQSWYKGSQNIMGSRFWLLNYFVESFSTSSTGRAMDQINIPGNWWTTCMKLKQELFTNTSPKPDLCKVQGHTLTRRGLLLGL